MGKSKLKKIMLILGFLLLAFLIGYFIWNTFFQRTTLRPELPIDDTGFPVDGLPTSPDGPGQIVDEGVFVPIEGSPDTPVQVSPEAPQIIGEVSSVASGGVTRTETIVPSPSLAPTLGRDGSSVQFYNREDGKFYITNENGDLIALSNKVFHSVANVEWAPNKTKAVLEYPDGNKIVYDFLTERQVTLPKHWEDFSFSTDSNKLVNKSLGIDPNNRWLIVSNSDGTQSRAVEFIGTNDKNVIPSWSPNNQTVAMYTRGVDFDRREVFFLGQNDENFKSTIVEGWGFSPLWSDAGDRLLYSVYSPNDDLKPKLWIVNAQGDNIGVNRRNLQIETWVEKCTFANETEVYCAVPKTLPKGAGLYPELALQTSDDLYRINTITGQRELVAVPDKAYNISSIIISNDGKNAFFTDYTTGQIHKIQLR